MRSFSKISLCLTAFLMIGTIAGVSATFNYAQDPADSVTAGQGVNLNGFIYVPEEMPDVEVTAVQRLSDILNGKYTTDTVSDSLQYLIDETIQVYWNDDPTQDPFVGSMDKEYEAEVKELFGDVLELQDEDLAFILKNQDLNGDGYNEIAMYSTSDPLDNWTSSYTGVVCVYVTVFTPIIDLSGNVAGYKQVCESLRGYCYEIYYSPKNQVPSFSTDEWRDSVAYTDRWNRTYELPDSAKLDFNSYNLTYRANNRNNSTKPYGKTLSQVLEGQF